MCWMETLTATGMFPTGDCSPAMNRQFSEYFCVLLFLFLPCSLFFYLIRVYRASNVFLLRRRTTRLLRKNRYGLRIVGEYGRIGE